MTKWSKEQDAVLREFASRGAERCAEELARRFGVSRKPDAIVRHANRVGISMFRYEICPSCGRKVKALPSKGICKACRQRELADAQRTFNARLRKEVGADYERDFVEARREYNRLRQRNHRSKRGEDGYGDSAKCPRKMSICRSGA